MISQREENLRKGEDEKGEARDTVHRVGCGFIFKLLKAIDDGGFVGSYRRIVSTSEEMFSFISSVLMF